MASAWRAGLRPVAEDFATHPELIRTPEAAVGLVYEEVCLREEFGEAIPPSELLARLPAWRTDLELLSRLSPFAARIHAC